MTTQASEDAHAPLGASVRGDWTVLLEELLAGVVHAGNNRFTALMSLAELAEIDGGSVDDARVMRQELARLHETMSYISLLVAQSGVEEPLEPHVLLNVALAVHELHPRVRSVSATLQRSGDDPPVRVPRPTLLRLMLLMVDAAKREAGAENGIIIQVSGDALVARLRIASAERPGADARAFAQLCGGTLAQDGDAWVLELPSLLARRQRERAGSG